MFLKMSSSFTGLYLGGKIMLVIIDSCPKKIFVFFVKSGQHCKKATHDLLPMSLSAECQVSAAVLSEQYSNMHINREEEIHIFLG